MTTVRRSVEQTISRLVTRTLRERASVAGTAAARSDAPQALATLIDQTWLDDDSTNLAAWCANAVVYSFGCVVVPLPSVAACLDLVSGSQVRVGTSVDTLAELGSALEQGVQEVELVPTAAIIHDDAQFSAYLRSVGEACYASGVLVKLNLATQSLSSKVLLGACARAATADVNLVVVPSALIADVQPALNPTTGIKVAQVVTLAQARQYLTVGVSRLGTTNGTLLMEAARQ